MAARQGGVVDHAALLALGLSGSGIHRRVAGGRLHRVHRGVYAVGSPRLSAADGGGRPSWLRAGRVLSHRSPAAAWDLVRATGVRVDVSVGLGGRAARDGIRLHRTRSLQPTR